MRLPRFLSLLLLPPAALLAVAMTHCAGGDEEEQQPVAETGSETESDAETSIPETSGETTPDTAVPDTAPTVSCSKAPTYAAPVRVNHNPDSLRRVANAGMVMLDDGRLMIAMLEAVDTGSRHALWVRTFDPATGMAAADQRLDADADALVDTSPFQIFAISGGAIGVRYGDGHIRVYSKGKWSPDLASAMPLATSDDLGFLAARGGQVLVTRARTMPPSGQAIVFRPDEGGGSGSWSAVQTLDIDGASGKPRIDRLLFSDDRFAVLVWQGGGGPIVRTRSLSGSWGTPSPKAEIGLVDASPQYQLLDDNSIVLIGLEGTGDTRKVVTTTWTTTDNWSTARLLSKPTADANGVVPVGAGQMLFSVSSSEVEFVAWVGACAATAKDCAFSARSRRYSGGAWKDPVDLDIGDGRNGPDGTAVIALDGSTPLVLRYKADRTNAELRVRSGASYTPKMVLAKDSPLFDDTTLLTANFYGSAGNLWALVRRERAPDGGMPSNLAMALGKLDPTGGTAKWGLITAGAFELRTFSDYYPYADGAGGFTVGSTQATDGTTTTPIIAHANTPGGMTEAASVISSDEKSANFANVPRALPRPGRDRSAIYVVRAQPMDPGNRLRAYAYNGIGGAVPKVLANETRAPRTFADSLVVFGCGGAILYAADPMDGSHTLELVIVKEADG